MRASFSVLIPDGGSEFALFAAHCLAQFRGVKIHALADEKWAPIRFSRYCHSFTHKQAGTDDKIRLNILEDVVKKHKIDVLLPTETKWITFVARHREAISKFVAVVPLPDPESLALANNKWLLAQKLIESDIPGPPTVLVTLDHIFEEKLQELQFPVLLKPITAWGGDGIEPFEDIASLKQYLEQHNPENFKNRFIVQSRLTGYVVGVNVLAKEGKILAATMQRGIIPNTQKFAAAGAIKFIKDDKFFHIAEKLVTTLKWAGFANLDTFYDSQDDQLKILEINARFWGSLRGSLVAGVSFPYLACLAALDVPFLMPDYQLARYAHTKTAIRSWGAKLLGKDQENGFPLKETGLKFLLTDPLAESVRAFGQEALAKEPTFV
ncbi:MAG: ATP-grasp domain-containing protein [Chloroflexota bacterium]|nr:ATP-grasp domain-containing protein [Chloroflexota bacterium]